MPNPKSTAPLIILLPQSPISRPSGVLLSAISITTKGPTSDSMPGSLCVQRFCVSNQHCHGIVAPYLKFLGRMSLGPVLSWMCSVFHYLLWCVVGALHGKRCRLPLIGTWADEQAYR